MAARPAHTALILGGGVGGIVVANELRKRAKANDRILLVERNPVHVFAPSFLWVAVGTRRPDRVARPLRELLRPGVELALGSVTSLDPANLRATIDGRGITADSVVIALGAELSPESVPGLAEAGHNFYTLAGATALRDALARFSGGKVIVLTARPGYKCPAAPYEQAMLIGHALKKRGLHEKFAVEIHAAEPAPMPVAGPAISEALRSMLGAKNIAYFPNRQVRTVDAASRTIAFSDGTSTSYDLLAFVPPHHPPAVVADAGFGGESGWIPADRATLQTRFANVYAVGDVAALSLENGKPLPKAGVFANAEARIVAENIAAQWSSSAATARFNGHGACFVETGGSRAALGSGDFFAKPAPAITLRAPSVFWHLEKVLLEKRWLHRPPFSFI